MSDFEKKFDNVSKLCFQLLPSQIAQIFHQNLFDPSPTRASDMTTVWIFLFKYDHV